MIIKEYDVGWGAEWPLKQLEKQVVADMLATYASDNSRSVVVNSVWYNGDYHQQVLAELKILNPSHVFVVAMLDPPIVQLEWFEELGCKVTGLGYYPGSGFVDFFALAMNKFFAVLDNDTLLNELTIDTPFMCLNRKPHPHRVRLFTGLKNANLLDQGFVSLGGTPPVRVLANDCDGQDLAPNGGTEQYGIANDIVTLGDLPRWQRHLVNIVTETAWDISQSRFFSEKTYKPILGLRPFLIYTPGCGADSLVSKGFESYVNDFRDIADVDLTESYNVVPFLSELSKQPTSYLQMKFLQLREKLLFNQDHFKKYVSQQKYIL